MSQRPARACANSGSLRFFAGVKTQVLKQENITGNESPRLRGDLFADAVGRHGDGPVKQFTEPSRRPA